ncbi:MAG TPA: HU family DNA-binding protein [Candidatus Azoamicus sp.]
MQNIEIKQYLTKQKLLQHIANNTGLSKKNVNSVFETLAETIKNHMKKDGPEKFILPGLLKLTIKNVPEQKEKIGFNPFTKKEMKFKAKPASRKIKVRLLKNLKDMVK